MLKRLIRFAALVTVVVTVVWLTREKMLPTPHVPHEPPPHYRSTPPPAPQPDDLTEIKGIGPVYASRLSDMGITTFRTLADANPETIATALGLSLESAADWASQAAARIG
ncbi:MAG: helix-hairpin-helix domain-containing protein [Acidimicrobiia bacterium]|nr:helix-hairpin-helix domain-containing protein [Acidimicrobiia bacterium]